MVEKKKKQRRPIHDLVLAATKQVWMAPAWKRRRSRDAKISILTLAAIE